MFLMSGAALLLTVAQARALTIIPNFSSLGTVYQDSTNNELYTTGGATRTNVTAAFVSNVNTAISYWDAAILLPYTVTTTFVLADLSSLSAAGLSHIDSTDANGRPQTTTVSVDTGNVAFFVDPTPQSNSEYAITPVSASLGGGTVNVGRQGSSLGGAASDGYDLLSLLLHEIEHSIGFSTGLARFDDAVDSTGTMLTIPTSVSGLPSSYVVPISGTHIDGNAENGLFNQTTIALPGFNAGERALLTAVDIESICTIQGCSPGQYNTNPQLAVSTVPEPGSLLLLSTAGLGLIGLGRRNRTKAA